MFQRVRVVLGLRVLPLLGVLAAMAVLPASTTAASSSSPTPQVATQCFGSLKKAPTTDEPNTISYKFVCDEGITAYTLVVNREPSDTTTVDDFLGGPQGFDPAGNPVTTVSWSCNGIIPGDGVSCSTGDPTKPLPAPDTTKGTFDTTDPYCANIPKGTNTVEPKALVQLIVTNSSGQQAGPFRLGLHPACGPAPKPKVKSKAKSKKNAKAKAKRTGKAKKHNRRTK